MRDFVATSKASASGPATPCWLVAARLQWDQGSYTAPPGLPWDPSASALRRGFECKAGTGPWEGRGLSEVLAVFVLACLNRSRKLLLYFTNETKKTEQNSKDLKGRVEGRHWDLCFGFSGTVASLPITREGLSSPRLFPSAPRRSELRRETT